MNRLVEALQFLFREYSLKATAPDLKVLVEYLHQLLLKLVSLIAVFAPRTILDLVFAMNKEIVKKYLPKGMRSAYRSLRGFSSRRFLRDRVLIGLYAHRILAPRLSKKLARRKHPLKYLFVISPMRSGSTLVVHILNGHSDIVGYGENHTSYSSRKDLSFLLARTSLFEPQFKGSEDYIMDKMVRNYEISDELLASDQVYFLFLLREPDSTFSSMGKLAEYMPEHKTINRWQNHDYCLDYYKARLSFMANIARRVNDPKRCMLLQYEALLDDTAFTLRSIQQFLGLETPLSEEYPTSKTTGLFRFGDVSPNIKSGKIQRNSAPFNTSKKPASPAIAEAREIQTDTLKYISSCCGTVMVTEQVKDSIGCVNTSAR